MKTALAAAAFRRPLDAQHRLGRKIAAVAIARAHLARVAPAMRAGRCALENIADALAAQHHDGRGKWNAGDGIRRTIRFLEKMECTILSGHRRVAPFGLAGGSDGQVGDNSVRRKAGAIEKLKGCDATVIDAGEAVIIQTPTAGGYGKPLVG